MRGRALYSLQAVAVMAGGLLCVAFAAGAVEAPPAGVRGDDIWLSGGQVLAALGGVAVFAWGAANMVKGLQTSAERQRETAARVEELEIKVDELAAQLRVLAARIEVLLGEHMGHAHAGTSGEHGHETPRASARMSGKG